MKWYVLFVMCSALFLAGCSGTHCITVGGNYEGVEGSVEYCHDFGESEKAGVPALSGGDKTLYAFDLETIKKLTEKLKNVSGLSVSSIEETSQDHPVQELLKLIEENE